LLQGSGGISVSVGNDSGDSTEGIVVRIKADAPVLHPDEPVPVPFQNRDTRAADRPSSILRIFAHTPGADVQRLLQMVWFCT